MRINISKLLLSLIILLNSAYIQAQEKSNEDVDILLLDPNLSLKYQRGGHLVYDCSGKHWVCTGSNEFKNCLESRKIAKNENLPKFGCASIKKFDSEKACTDYQMKLISASMGNNFCLNPGFEFIL